MQRGKAGERQAFKHIAADPLPDRHLTSNLHSSSGLLLLGLQKTKSSGDLLATIFSMSFSADFVSKNRSQLRSMV